MNYLFILLINKIRNGNGETHAAIGTIRKENEKQKKKHVNFYKAYVQNHSDYTLFVKLSFYLPATRSVVIQISKDKTMEEVQSPFRLTSMSDGFFKKY